MADTENALAVIDQGRSDLVVSRPPEVVLAEARKAAAAIADVLARKSHKVIINDQQYLEFEDWQTLGRFYGVTAKAVESRYVEYGSAHGFEARAVAIRATDGMEISAAESMCLDDEDRWKDRELFQLKSMAQTRACAKALRNVLAWVAVLGGYGATPAEEMDGVRGRESEKAKPAADGSVLVADVREDKRDPNGKWIKYVVTFDTGEMLSTLDDDLAEKARETKAAGARVIPVTEKKGKYTNLTGLTVVQPVIDAEPMLPIEPDTEPIGQPEKVLTVRKSSSGTYWVICTDRREYVTAMSEVADAAERIRVTGGRAIVQFEPAQGTNAVHNKIVEFGEAKGER